MPRVGTFAGIALFIYAGDHNPPHVHAYYGEFSAQIVIETANVLDGYLPSNKLKAARAWVRENQVMLMQVWNDLNP